MKRARGFAKSRTGCQSCKDRKIKCDEVKPECEACLRSGLRCPGYVRPLRWSRKHEMHSSTSATSPKSPTQQNGTQDDSGAGLSHDARPDFLSASLIEASGRMPDWLDLSLNGDDAELAFQDATSFLNQDLMMTPPLMFPDDPLLPMDATAGLLSNGAEACDLALLPPTPAGSDNTLVARGTDNDSGTQAARKSGHAASASQGSNGPRALLHTFYRLSSPNSVHRLSDDDFVRHYFKHVCRLLSCFDSDLNPFRSLAQKWYKTCPTVSYTIQSMAIAHIANWYPYMAKLCVSKRNQAWRSLQKDLQRLSQLDPDKALLCLFLLGISASWQPISSLGLQYLHITRNLVQSKLRAPSIGKEAESLNDFWAGALVHWEMLASFVDPVPIATFDGHGMPELSPEPLEGPVMPHPWTGVVNELQFVVAEVGRVARRRQQWSTRDQKTPAEVDQPWLENLEKLMLSTTIPEQSLIEDYKDPDTSKIHIIRSAQAYKMFGLLEIYRLHPDLLRERIVGAKNDQFPFNFTEGTTGYIREIDSYLASMASQILALIGNIPLTSGVCRLQPLLLVACASQLHFPDLPDAADETDNFDEKYNDITQDRYLVEARMFALSRKGPQGPILKAIAIIKEVWDRLDRAEYGNWVDVMHEKDLQVILA